MTDKELQNEYASWLAKLADQVRSGDIRVVSVNQSRPYSRYYDKDGTSHHFTPHPITTSFAYENVQHVEEQKAKEKAFAETRADGDGEYVTGQEHVCSSCLGGKRQLMIDFPAPVKG